MNIHTHICINAATDINKIRRDTYELHMHADSNIKLWLIVVHQIPNPLVLLLKIYLFISITKRANRQNSQVINI